MLEDLKLAFRRLRHSPGFVAVATLTLAVVVGANTAILGVADAVLFRPLPFTDPDRVFLLQILNQPGGTRSTRFDNAFIDAINQHHQGVGEVGIFGGGPRVIADGPDGPEQVSTMGVAAGYLRVLGVAAARGRTFADGDTPGRSAMLTYGAWRDRFGGAADVVGRTVTIGTSAFDIVGVLPPAFNPATGTFFSGRPEVVVLMAPVAAGKPGGTFHPVVRLEPGVTREQAQAEMQSVAAHAYATDPKLSSQTPLLEDIRETIYPVGRDVMRFLLAAAALVLLVGCANVANMLLARGHGYERETAVRSALGASRSRIVRPLIFEALIIGSVGAVLAVLLTAAGFSALLEQVPSAAYGNARVGIDLRVGLMSLALGLAGGVVFAVMPAMRAARVDVLAILQSRVGRARTPWRAGRVLLAGQVALAVVLVLGAAIAARAFVSVLRTPLGFDPDRVVQLDVAAPRGTTDFAGHYRRVVDQLAARPDVVAAGATGTPPMGGWGAWSGIVRPGTKERIASLVHTYPGYFEAIGAAPVAGRTLRWEDAGTGVVLTEGAARAIFGDAPALGQIVDTGGTGALRVVGIVPAQRMSLADDVAALTHAHTVPAGRTSLAVVYAKMRARDESVLRTLRRDLAGVASGSPISARWWTDSLASGSSFRDPRFQAMVLGSFAAIAIGLTALGVFGIVAFLVASRRREMGVRLAIGAEPRALVRLMVWQALVPVGVGLAAGLLSANWAARWAESRFVRLDTSDPWTLVIAAAVVIAATTLAALVPARRAARIDPTVVLKAV